jgi:hypothetical protein
VWFGREVVGPVCAAQSIPVASTVRWAPYPQYYGADAAQRLSVAAWDAYSGVLGHQHAPDNLHGDPGAIDIETILSAARGDDDMPLTDDDLEKVEDRMRAVLNEGTAKGQVSWAGTSIAQLATEQSNANRLNALSAAVSVLTGKVADIDVTIDGVTQLGDADLAAIAKAVNDEQARRQAE